jgi:hypothetical protein
VRIPQRRLNGRFFHILVFLTALVWVSLDVAYTRMYWRIQEWLFVGVSFPEHDGDYFRAAHLHRPRLPLRDRIPGCPREVGGDAPRRRRPRFRRKPPVAGAGNALLAQAGAETSG